VECIFSKSVDSTTLGGKSPYQAGGPAQPEPHEVVHTQMQTQHLGQSRTMDNCRSASNQPVVDMPSLEVVKGRLDRALGNFV